MFLSAHEAVPVGSYLGARARLLKAVGQRLHPAGEPLKRLGDGRIGRQRRRFGDAGTGPHVLQLVGQQQGGDQEMAGLRQAAKRLGRLAGVAIDGRGQPVQMSLLAIAAGDVVTPAPDLDVDIGNLPALPRGDQGVELGEGARDPAFHLLMDDAQLLMPFAVVGRGGARSHRLDPGERPLDPRDGIQSALVGHGVTIA